MLVSGNVPRGFITIKLTSSWENICFRKFFQASKIRKSKMMIDVFFVVSSSSENVLIRYHIMSH